MLIDAAYGLLSLAGRPSVLPLNFRHRVAKAGLPAVGRSAFLYWDKTVCGFGKNRRPDWCPGCGFGRVKSQERTSAAFEDGHGRGGLLKTVWQAERGRTG